MRASRSANSSSSRRERFAPARCSSVAWAAAAFFSARSSRISATDRRRPAGSRPTISRAAATLPVSASNRARYPSTRSMSGDRTLRGSASRARSSSTSAASISPRRAPDVRELEACHEQEDRTSVPYDHHAALEEVFGFVEPIVLVRERSERAEGIIGAEVVVRVELADRGRGALGRDPGRFQLAHLELRVREDAVEDHAVELGPLTLLGRERSNSSRPPRGRRCRCSYAPTRVGCRCRPVRRRRGVRAPVLRAPRVLPPRPRRANRA